MPRLILLNGPPASGKSTLAARFCDTRPFMLNLDVDVIRSLLGSWQNDPHAALLLLLQILLDLPFAFHHRRQRDMPDLMTALLNNGQAVSSFPVHEYWQDVGQPNDLMDARRSYSEIFALSPTVRK